MPTRSETDGRHSFRGWRAPVVSVLLALVSSCAFLVAPISSGSLVSQPPPTPQQKAPTAEELFSLRQRAEMGDAAAQHALGALYLSGQGVPMDRAEALKWFALEAHANGDEKPELYSAFDSIAATVDQSEMEQAVMRAHLWASDLGRRSPSPGRWKGKSLASIFGVTLPRLKKEVKPKYPKAAKERKIEGIVELDCVVKADGKAGECQVVRSLDTVYGLDQEALKAARKWRFEPATIRSQPASFPITIEFTFTLRCEQDS